MYNNKKECHDDEQEKAKTVQWQSTFSSLRRRDPEKLPIRSDPELISPIPSSPFQILSTPICVCALIQENFYWLSTTNYT